MKIDIKPLSVNQVWQGRRFKTPIYKQYEKDLLLLLPAKKINTKAKLKVELTYGFSSKAADIDNPCKPILDVLQKKYGINDNKIYELNQKKEIVKKGKEFIIIEIQEI